jgi:aminoglycoside phosphotransferase (APT) family kinase protein
MKESMSGASEVLRVVSLLMPAHGGYDSATDTQGIAMLAAAAAVRDVVLGASPWVPGQKRYRPESVTTDELTLALGRNTPSARVEAMRVQADSKGTTDRARLHLTWNAAGQAAHLPASVFVKGTPSQVMSRVIVSTFGCHTYESRFFETVYPTVADLTITPYLSRCGRGGRYVVVVEDMTQAPGVRFYVADDAAPQAHVEAVVDALATLHGRFWKSPRFASDLAWLAPISRRPGSPVMNRLFRWSAQRFFTQDRDVPVAVRRITEQFVDNQATLLRAWESMPPTLCHGDMHLGNTFSTPDGTAGIYDWQVCHRMNGLRDFSYFLTHSIPTDLRRREERNLLARYLDGLAQAGAGRETPSVDDAFNCYRVLTVYGWMAVVVTLAAGGMQPDDRMEVAARRAATTLIDLDVEGALAAQLYGALRLPH